MRVNHRSHADWMSPSVASVDKTSWDKVKCSHGTNDTWEPAWCYDALIKMLQLRTTVLSKWHQEQHGCVRAPEVWDKSFLSNSWAEMIAIHNKASSTSQLIRLRHTLNAKLHVCTPAFEDIMQLHMFRWMSLITLGLVLYLTQWSPWWFKASINTRLLASASYSSFCVLMCKATVCRSSVFWYK